MPHRYFVTRDGVEREVTLSEFCSAEREAGFRGPGHWEDPPYPATASFSSGTIRGRVKWDGPDNADR